MTEFISRKYGNDDYEVIIKTDNPEHYKAAEEFARQLIEHGKSLTNLDRIRRISDAELATIMVQLADLDARIGYCQELPECHAMLDTEESIPLEKCAGCMLEWLHRPAVEVSE